MGNQEETKDTGAMKAQNEEKGSPVKRTGSQT